MSKKPSLPKGTRDFIPEVLSKRNYIIDTIKKQFELHGFSQIETPAMENNSTLMGKYGDEGDKLIFKILNSGEFNKKIDGVCSHYKPFELIDKMSSKSLRYDLTVPFARFVVQNQNDLVFPFKRYQIQPVWRADRPQRGRFREFCQCDADVVGSKSLWQEVGLISLYDKVYSKLGLNVSIKLNNRKILSGISEIASIQDKLIEFTTALDKLDKIGEDKVKGEMLNRGIGKESIDKLKFLFDMKGAFSDKMKVLKEKLQTSDIGMQGVSEMEFIYDNVSKVGLNMSRLDLDVTLARGLDYYTGSIFEIKALDIELGSIGGGGRYDDLTGVFGLKNMPGVGISFGLDRMYLALEELNLFDDNSTNSTNILFTNFGQDEALRSMKIINALREENISSEMYPDNAKIKKQMSYAHKRGVSYVVMIGKTELDNDNMVLKDMKTGEQKTVLWRELLEIVRA